MNKAQPTHGNENKIRLIALIVFFMILVYHFTHFIILPLILLFDFWTRGYGIAILSPLGYLADRFIRTYNISTKLIFLPPKRFAARLGFGFSAFILLFHLFGINTSFLDFLLAICAGLESFLSVCVGCYVFHYIKKFGILS